MEPPSLQEFECKPTGCNGKCNSGFLHWLRSYGLGGLAGDEEDHDEVAASTLQAAVVPLDFAMFAEHHLYALAPALVNPNEFPFNLRRKIAQ